MDKISLLLPYAIVAYCLVQIANDLRRKSYVMVAIGLLCVAALLFAPFPTHAVFYKP